jgi:hypothetical protein
MIIFPAILESFRSLKDKTLKVTFESNELTPEQLTGIAQMINSFGYIAFKNTPFKDREKEFIDTLEPEYNDTGKTPSQRLRAVLYRLWEQTPEGYEDFNRYYDFRMEQLIKHFKTKLD